MRSVSVFSFSMSYCSTLTCFKISSQASCGMILSFAWARARPASKSRYFWMRLPSDHTCRMASVPKISLKMAESIVPVGMVSLSDWQVVAGLAPAIHDLLIKDVDARHKAGHDVEW